MSKMCYIKPTRFKHSSGFRTFEVGYITKMSDDGKVLEKDVVTSGSDHIYQNYAALYDTKQAFGINMDLTNDGYIRIWGNGKKEVHWESDTGYSSMELTIEPKEEL